LDANFLISDAATTTDDLAPSIVYNAVSDRYLVVYQDGRNAATRGDDVHGQRVRSSGALSGRAWRFSGNAAVEDDADPVLVYNENGNQYLVAWADSRNLATRGWDVYARRVGG
jgi:hypothetical protein